MMRCTAPAISALTVWIFALSLSLGQLRAQPPKKFEDFDVVVKGAKEYEGLLRLYQKDEHVYAEIPRELLDKPLLCPIAIARGLGMGGDTLNFGEQWLLVFRRVGDKIHVVRRNARFQAKKNTPVARAVDITYTDSILLAVRIQSIHPSRQGVLIDLNDVFLRDFAQLDIGGMDSNRSYWHKIKAYPKNIELQLAATFTTGRGDTSVIDPRGTTVLIHYGLVQMPEEGYQPRLADDRIGYFLSVVKDFSSDNKETSFVRYINRWRVERADPDSKRLSVPKKRIVFWIENSVPHEYRAYVREGILEWNKAFEKIGLRDVIEVRQQEDEDFEPEDMSYNTFRWIATDRGFARGPSRTNPLTGEILDADIVFDASMVRYWKSQHHLTNTNMDREASLIRSSRLGFGLEDPLTKMRQANNPSWNERAHSSEPGDARSWMLQQGVCQCGSHLSYELGMAAMAWAARDGLKSGEQVPEELVGQAVKEVTMHEVGHTLGLRHNFKASTYLKNDQLHDTNITRKQGLVGSVMDYPAINLAPKGGKQGDYFSTTLGPYDYWAIEYGYKPLSGGTDGETATLQEIAARCAQPGHDYGTDEDMFATPDPLTNVWDLGSDPMKFAQDRMLLAEELLKNLADRVVDKGEGYQRTRLAFNLLLRQYGDGAQLVSNFVGGEYFHRDHKGDPNGRDPLVPVPSTKQREALKFLQDHILTDKPFQFSPQLLRRLGAERWYHWGQNSAMASVEYPLHERVLDIQRIVLDNLLSPGVLRRIQNTSLKVEKQDNPLTIAEVFRSLSDGIFGELSSESKGSKRSLESSVLRRNLQREYLRELMGLVTGSRNGNAPPDARSLARLHLREIGKRIEATLADKQVSVDDTTRAHLEESQERIAKVLAASVHLNE